jgi:hypothetical protein
VPSTPHRREPKQQQHGRSIN